jgi:hypothetical protein
LLRWLAAETLNIFGALAPRETRKRLYARSQAWLARPLLELAPHR